MSCKQKLKVWKQVNLKAVVQASYKHLLIEVNLNSKIPNRFSSVPHFLNSATPPLWLSPSQSFSPLRLCLSALSSHNRSLASLSQLAWPKRRRRVQLRHDLLQQHPADFRRRLIPILIKSSCVILEVQKFWFYQRCFQLPSPFFTLCFGLCSLSSQVRVELISLLRLLRYSAPQLVRKSNA
ncbi:uncharacterized protein LOC133722873 [Rosa rugosa]|uniref:uncharacterized protein LOC133722873 n=1 Tax=Rosa rugosa TaxID=74645 RepID=UPI002B4109B5|nr:uncharacterized protein LOC133722873 [Rosa rugosa]